MKKLIIFPCRQWNKTKIFYGTKLFPVPLARVENCMGASRRRTPRIFPANEAWPNHRLTAENGGSEWQNGGGSVVESRASGAHACSLRVVTHATSSYLSDAQLALRHTRKKYDAQLGNRQWRKSRGNINRKARAQLISTEPASTQLRLTSVPVWFRFSTIRGKTNQVSHLKWRKLSWNRSLQGPFPLLWVQRELRKQTT